MTGKRRKVKKLPISSSSNRSSAAGPSIEAGVSQEVSDEPYQMTRDMAITGLNIIKDVADVSGVLAPLKVTCALLIRCLEVTKVRDSFIRALKY
jgi:hypothetical protein